MESFDMQQNIPCLEKANTCFGQAKKMVKTPADLPLWIRSEAYNDLVGFINGISTAIQGKRINDNLHVSPTMKNLISMFDALHKLVDETPCAEQPQRFGNKAYRTWALKMHQDISLFLNKAVPQDQCDLINELGGYLSESFGNAVRIDYGTGHELSFMFFLCGLFKARILVEDDNVATALRLFNAYIHFIRRLIKVYRMEPAGSQGVWSLDDYQFVPFIWGSAQLAFQSPFEPANFLEPDIINAHKDNYMFIGCIDYISQVKTGHFAEHSNQLWSISAVPTWAKINTGLLKMYQKEILSKFPIIQHVQFGTLMSFNSVAVGTTIQNARLGYQPGPGSATMRADGVQQKEVVEKTIAAQNNPGDADLARKKIEETTKVTVSKQGDADQAQKKVEDKKTIGITTSAGADQAKKPRPNDITECERKPKRPEAI